MEGLVGAPVGTLSEFYKGRRVLVTGHTGFKGSWLSLWLSELGSEVTGYALEPSTEPSHFELCGVKDTMTSVTGDVRDVAALGRVFKDHSPEIVFHLAAQSLVRRSYREPALTYETNVMGTVNLLEECRRTPSVRAVVNVTSDKCYENDSPSPERPFTEDDPKGGHDPYSSSKGCAELVAAAYGRSFFNPSDYAPDHGSRGVALASARAGNAIGGGDFAEDRLVPDCARAFMDGDAVVLRYPDAVRPWQHVLDPLYGYLLLAMKLREEGPRFAGGWNFGPLDEEPLSAKWVVERMIELWGGGCTWRADTSEHPHEAGCLMLDCTKAKTELGWRPQWDLETSLVKIVEWFKALAGDKADGKMAEISIDQIRSYEEALYSGAAKGA